MISSEVMDMSFYCHTGFHTAALGLQQLLLLPLTKPVRASSLPVSMYHLCVRKGGLAFSISCINMDYITQVSSILGTKGSLINNDTRTTGVSGTVSGKSGHTSPHLGLNIWLVLNSVTHEQFPILPLNSCPIQHSFPALSREGSVFSSSASLPINIPNFSVCEPYALFARKPSRSFLKSDS